MFTELADNETLIPYKGGCIIVSEYESVNDGIKWFTAHVDCEGWDVEKCVPDLRTFDRAVIEGKRLYDEYKRAFGWG